MGGDGATGGVRPSTVNVALPAADAPPRPEDGRIPYCYRVGVTGHRTLPADAALAARVRETLDHLRRVAPSSPDTPARLAVVSPVAEGADRLVAHAGLEEPGVTLEVMLPLPRDEYLKDFATDASRREFAALLARASEITVVPPTETRGEAYERVGQHVVSRCDALVALWDGLPARGRGGTAEVVALARRHGLPLSWIETAAPFTLHEDPGVHRDQAEFEKLDAFNRETVDRAALARQVEAERARLLAAAAAAGLPGDPVDACCRWILPPFVRADTLAQRYQVHYRRLGDAAYWLSALAVAVVACQSAFLPQWPQLAFVEVALMLVALAVQWVGQRWRVHERWISYRFLAEQCRARLFLGLAGVGSDRVEVAEEVTAEHPTQPWLARAADEVWRARPHPALDEGQTHPLRAFLAAAWIGDQLAYQRRVATRLGRYERRLAALGLLSLIATLVTAALYGANVFAGLTGWVLALLVGAVVLPAIAQALRGIAAQREFARHAARTGQMARALEQAQRAMERAPTLERIGRVARQVEAIMLSENHDWFATMLPHDFSPLW